MRPCATLVGCGECMRTRGMCVACMLACVLSYCNQSQPGLQLSYPFSILSHISTPALLPPTHTPYLRVLC
jgi:hypothetical protein